MSSNLQGQEQKQDKEMYEVLVIYSSGFSVEDIYDKSHYQVDAITSPTPLNVSCGSVAERLVFYLREMNIKVRLIEAQEIKHYDEILSASVVAIGSPAYFSNVSWEIKKIFDVQFHKIYMLKKKKLDRKIIAAFATSEVKSSAMAALNAIEKVIEDCKGDFGPTIIILTGYSKFKVDREIKKFAKKIAKLVPDRKSR
jgi:flavorubredoxin